MNVTGGRLLDDIKDHWRAAGHDKERGYFFTKLFDWAHQTKSRVCLISGDVHIGATGCVYHTKYMKESNSGCLNRYTLLPKPSQLQPCTDHLCASCSPSAFFWEKQNLILWFFSLITSAIVNVPPPDYVPKTLELNAAFKDKVTSDIVGCLAR